VLHGLVYRRARLNGRNDPLLCESLGSFPIGIRGGAEESRGKRERVCCSHTRLRCLLPVTLRGEQADAADSITCLAVTRSCAAITSFPHCETTQVAPSGPG
jgi:hypothetical protein